MTTLTFLYGNNILAHISVSTPTTILTTKCKHSETKFHVESCLTATGQYSNTTSDTSMELPILGKVRNSCAKIKQVYGQLGILICQDFDALHTLYFLQEPFAEPLFEINTFLFFCFLSQFHLISCVKSQKFLEVRYTACTCSKPRLPCP